MVKQTRAAMMMQETQRGHDKQIQNKSCGGGFPCDLWVVSKTVVSLSIFSDFELFEIRTKFQIVSTDSRLFRIILANVFWDLFTRPFLKNTVPTTTTTNTCKSRLMLVYLLTKTQETRHRNHKRIESTGLDYNISIPFFLTLLTSIRFTLNIQH
jgi:hypothetical protein